MSISTDKIVFPCGMSRSGTTLLATVLDSHSQISMGYELIPPEMSGGLDLLSILRYGLGLCQSNFSICGKALRNSGFPREGLFFTRCYRAGIDGNDLILLLNQMHDLGIESINTFRQRLEVAWMIARRSAEKREKAVYGFKLNTPSVEKAYELFPNGRFIYIVRDPRDVVASHLTKGFKRTIPEICTAWCNYTLSFNNFKKKYHASGFILRYEDIVTSPEYIISDLFDFVGLPMENSVLEFYKSKAGVHTYGHPNSNALKRNFFTSSIGRWKSDLDQKQISMIEKHCCEQMTEYGYTSAI